MATSRESFRPCSDCQPNSIFAVSRYSRVWTAKDPHEMRSLHIWSKPYLEVVLNDIQIVSVWTLRSDFKVFCTLATWRENQCDRSAPEQFQNPHCVLSKQRNCLEGKMMDLRLTSIHCYNNNPYWKVGDVWTHKSDLITCKNSGDMRNKSIFACSWNKAFELENTTWEEVSFSPVWIFIAFFKLST